MRRKTFFDVVRRSVFGGALNASQVAGMTAILDEWQRRCLTDLRWLAYMLATTFHETAKTMQPIEEHGRGKGKRYGQPVNGKTYYGRGYVQLTWVANYRAMADLLGVDLVARPGLALEPDTAAAILFEGMTRGTFTGKRLADYFGDDKTDWRGARKIINGTDKADQIAEHAIAFHAALLAATDDERVPIPPKRPARPKPPAPSLSPPAPPDVEPVPAPKPPEEESVSKRLLKWIGVPLFGTGGLAWLGNLFDFADWKEAAVVMGGLALLAVVALVTALLWRKRRKRR